MLSMQIQTFTDAQSFIQESAHVLLDACQPHDILRPTYMALSGGHTPREVYKYFAEVLLPNKDCRIHGYMVDERYVPMTHEGSNGRMIQELIIEPAETAAPNHIVEWTFFQTQKEIPAALDAYTSALKDMTETGATFDIVVLGIGKDGHIASLFPHTPALHETNTAATHVEIEDSPYPHRLTLTFPPIMAAKQILLLAAGTEKKSILEKLIKGDASIDAFPAKKLLEHPNLLIHYKS
jgi:6-phosphogluconolactonase